MSQATDVCEVEASVPNAPRFHLDIQASLLGPHPLGSAILPLHKSAFLQRYVCLTSLILVQIPMFSEISGFKCGLLAWFSVLGMARRRKDYLRCL